MIAPGNVIKSSEIKKLAAITLKNQANLYYNLELANAWVDNQKYNLIYYFLNRSNPFSTTLGNPTSCVNNYNVFMHNGVVYAGEVYDYMEGTTVDTNKWETDGTFSQSDNSYVEAYTIINSSHNGWLYRNLSTKALNLKPSSGTEAECIFKAYLDSVSDYSGNVHYCSIYLEGSSGGSYLIDTVTDAASLTLTKIYRLVFNNGTCYVYDITSSWSNGPITSFSTSDLSGDWKLRASTGAYFEHNCSTHMRFYPIVYVKNNTVSGNSYQAETNTLLEYNSNINNVFVTWKGDNNITFYVSSDNGANYNPSQDNFATISNAGTQLKLKFDFGGTYTQIPKMYYFACYYNCW